jgi:hypothetical protein
VKDVRFYLEFRSSYAKRKGKDHTGNCIARFLNDDPFVLEGLASLFSWPNSPVASTSFRRSFLRLRCKRITEAKAREIHPRLFEFLE